MYIHCRAVPLEVLLGYDLTPKFFDSHDYAYLGICKGMYGLKEASILACDQLLTCLSQYRYVPFKHTPDMWRHTTHPITFTPAVDDFESNILTNLILTTFSQLSGISIPSLWIGQA